MAYYALVERGERSLDTQLGSFDAGFQIQAMVNTSSDDSWLLLMKDIGYPKLIEYAASIGISYDPEQNLLTPTEMASLLKQLYAGQLLNPGHTEELLGYMQHTNDEELIPAAVPEGVTVNHKYGLLEGYVHDAAVLSSGGAAYAVAIYTWGASDADSPATHRSDPRADDGGYQRTVPAVAPASRRRDGPGVSGRKAWRRSRSWARSRGPCSGPRS